MKDYLRQRTYMGESLSYLDNLLGAIHSTYFAQRCFVS